MTVNYDAFTEACKRENLQIVVDDGAPGVTGDLVTVMHVHKGNGPVADFIFSQFANAKNGKAVPDHYLFSCPSMAQGIFAAAGLTVG